MEAHKPETCPLCGAPTAAKVREPLDATIARQVLDNPAIVVQHAAAVTKIPAHFLRMAGEDVFQTTAEIVVAYIKKTKTTNVQEICEIVRRTFLALVEPLR